MLGPLARDGQSEELPRKPPREVRDVDHFLPFALAFSQDLAHFERYQGAKIVFELSQLFADLAHDLAALGGGEHAPALEYLDAFRDGAFVIIGGGEPDSSQFAAVGGVERGN